ncbi:MAG: aspartate aminotransferase family protein, partial [Syntrophaceae bacterium]|nr:aspartate aminotransferase family protein [Syntrophaceae bacterium]
MNEKKIMALADQHIMNTYRRAPIALVKGEGAKLWDASGREYLDFVAGIAVCNLGHSHPKVVKAIKKQAKELMHVSNLYYTKPQGEVAALLTKHSFADKAFFCNSGAEANEAAIKLARKYAHENLGADKFELITMKDSFHGRTMATITATGQEKFQFGFTPLLDGFTYAPFNDPAALEAAISPRTCGIMLEPIQGEGGVIIPDDGYLANVREICNRHKILMIVDEVQTGIGRTGKLFAYEYSGVKPDIMTLAKALGNGFPVGAMLATDEAARAFSPGNHASTFGGNLLAMAAVKATLETLINDGVLDHCQRMGSYFLARLQDLKARHALISEVRGRGLMLACSLTIDGADIVTSCQE